MSHIHNDSNKPKLVKNFALCLVLGCLLVLTACKKDTSILTSNEDESNNNKAKSPPSIVGITPSESTVNVGSSNLSFGVSVNGDAGQVTYTYKIDGTAVWQSYSGVYDLIGASMLAGAHSLEVDLENDLGTTSHTFNLFKNTAPTVDSTTPSVATGHLINCGGPSNFDIDLTFTTSDLDADSLSFSWSVNGVTNDPTLGIVDGAGTSTASFTPTCGYTGSNEVTASIFDGTDTVTYTWYVDVQTPIIADVTSVFPTDDPVVILSTSNQIFSASASGKPPVAYLWKMDGSTISGQTNPTIDIAGASYTVGNHVLTVEVSDSDSNDSHDFNVNINGPPTLMNHSPSTPFLLNYQTVQSFNVDGSDPNSDTITYTWKLNGATDASLSPSGDNSQADFTPHSGLVGDNTISVEASDGYESVSYSWSVNVNYFSDACNNLAAGEICTAVGQPGFGNGAFPATESDKIKVGASYMAIDSQDNWYVVDELDSVVWYYNRTNITSPPGQDLTVLGTLVKAGQAKVVIGTGGPSAETPDGTTAADFGLYYPRDIEVHDKDSDGTDDYIYLSEYYHDRVLRFDISTGTGYTLLGTGLKTENCTTNDDTGEPGNTQVCGNPTGLALDRSSNTLYVACYYNDIVKKVLLNDDLGSTQTNVVVGNVNNGSCLSTAGDIDGTLGGAGTSKTDNPYALDIDKAGNLYISDYPKCHIKVANNSAGTLSFFGGAKVANPGQLTTLVGGTCGSAVGSYTTAKFSRPYGMAVLEDYTAPTSGIDGFFIVSSIYEKVVFANNTALPLDFGGTTVAAYEVDVIAGTTSYGYNGDGILANTARLGSSYTHGLTLTDDSLFIMDRANGRVRRVDIESGSGDEGKIFTAFGSGNVRRQNSSNLLVDVPAEDAQLYFPRHLSFDANNNKLVISDTYNDMIRGLDLTTGALGPLVGDGNTSGNADVEGSTSGETNVPYGGAVTVRDELLFYTEYYTSTGSNRNSMARIWNFGSADDTLFGINILIDTVQSFASSYVLGSQNWSSISYEGNNATTVPLRSVSSVAYDGTNAYLVSNYNNCILKVDSVGDIFEHVGSCGYGASYYGDVDGSIGASEKLRYPNFILVDPQYESDGNLFVMDQNLSSYYTKIKYVNKSASPVSIFGVSVPAGEIQTVWTSSVKGYGYALAAYGNFLCLSHGYESNSVYGAHNVKCYDRTDSFGTLQMRVGAPDASIDARPSLADELEGVSASASTLFTPVGLSFDADGNLFIIERQPSVIRKVKRWW